MPVEAIELPPLDVSGVTFSFDLVPGWSASRTVDATEVVRPCVVRNLPISDGASDPEVLLRVTEHPACPQYGEAFPTLIPLWQGCTLQDIRLVSRTGKTNALLNLIYRKKSERGDGSSASSWSLNYTSTISHITTYSTATGGLIRVWYRAGEPATTITDGSAPPAAPGQPVVKPKSAAVHQMRVAGILTAETLMLGPAWLALKATIKGKRGHINSDTWGTDPRGTWFFVGPDTTTTDLNKSYRVRLQFLEADGRHFPLVVWHNKDGSHPADSAPESAFSTYPLVGDEFARNGITRVSIYPETEFSTMFSFVP